MQQAGRETHLALAVPAAVPAEIADLFEDAVAVIHAVAPVAARAALENLLARASGELTPAL